MEEGSWEEKLNEYKIPLALGLVGLVLLIGGLFSSGIIERTFIKSSKQISAKSTVPTTQASPNSYSSAKVDVSGEVTRPGVYALSLDARVEDAIKAAGGVKTSADPVFVSKSLNLAQKVSDGMKIYIPKAGEAGLPLYQNGTGQAASVKGLATTADSLIDLNNASASELDKLSGVGEVTAAKIIELRPYNSIEELLTKKAVTRATYEKIKTKVRI